MLTIGAFVLSAVIAYLLGSISFAIIVSKLFAHDDVRKYGSKNAGMTNILRTYGKLPALCTLIGDFLKGVLAVVIGRWIFLRRALPDLMQDILQDFCFAWTLISNLFRISGRKRGSYLIRNYTCCKSTGIFYPVGYLCAGIADYKDSVFGFDHRSAALSVHYPDCGFVSAQAGFI